MPGAPDGERRSTRRYMNARRNCKRDRIGRLRASQRLAPTDPRRLAAGDGTDDVERLFAGGDGVGQGSVRRIER
jgi:hypothetical protein